MKNCWEITKCGRQVNGENVKEMGVCPAALPNEFNGVHKGNAGGRFCWAINGTFCGGEINGTFAEKFITCLNCKVFKYVQDEEERYFNVTPAQAKLKR
ncbi:hypothetical protein DF185_02940 [Marinifilum breve]|uniref:Uncharacterized protein n=1 Tax=Marinifilum breve TaxID=2184082 RepID=A0A2V4A485_9BACT|nr:hypothetical protein [Marinifilum breve]PXY03063.1 hypothetical protein DF185_02940 [Marinifilum breve]